MVQTLWLFVVDLAAFGIGWGLYRRLLCPAEETLSEAIAYPLVLGMVAMGTAVFALGICQLLFPGVVVGTVLVCAALGGLKIATELLGSKRSFRKEPRDPMLIVSLSFLLLYLPQSYEPGLLHDSLVYHLALPRIYLERHGIVPLPFNLFANMPHNIELLNSLALAGGDIITAKLLMFQFNVLVLLGISSFAWRHLSAPLGGVLGFLYVAGPIVQWHLSRTYIEPAIACFLLFAFLVFFRWRHNRRLRTLLACCALGGWGASTRRGCPPQA